MKLQKVEDLLMLHIKLIIRELSLFTTMVSRGFVKKAVEAITESTNP